jgi:hypothetical protein
MIYVLPDGQIIGRQNFTLYGKPHRANVLDKAASRESLGIYTAERREGYNVVFDESEPENWRYEPESLDVLKAGVKARIKAKRDEVMYGGLVVGGVPVDTSLYGQDWIHRTYTMLKRNPDMAIRWKSPGGTFHDFGLAQVEAVLDAVGAWVESCWTAEAMKCGEVDALKTVSAILEYSVEADWPKK